MRALERKEIPTEEPVGDGELIAAPSGGKDFGSSARMDHDKLDDVEGVPIRVPVNEVIEELKTRIDEGGRQT